MMDIETVLAFCVGILSVGLSISTTELLAWRKEFAVHGVFSYQMSQHQTANRPFEGLRNFLNQPKVFVFGVLTIRLISALLSGIFSLVYGELHTFSLVLLFVSTWLVYTRCRLGFDGSDSMTLIIVTALTIASFFPSGNMVQYASLYFIAGQVLLAYTTAGILKAKCAIWARGDALEQILSTQAFGVNWVASILQKNKRFSRWLNWLVIGVECTLPLILIAPQEIAFVILIIGFMFHLTAALMMGLNGFVWAFLAGYPALFWVNQWTTNFLNNL